MRQLFAIIGSEMNCMSKIQSQLEYYCQFLDNTKVEQLLRSPLQKSRKFFDRITNQDGDPYGISNAYCTAFPLYQDIAAKIYASAPGVKLVYTVGNPMNRYILHYVSEVCPTNPHHIFTVDHIIPQSPYTLMGLYHTQILQYMTYFDESAIHVSILEDLQGGTDIEFDAIYEHIGLEQGLPIVEYMIQDEAGILALLQNDVRYTGLYETLTTYYRDSIEILGEYLSRDLFTLWDITPLEPA